MQLSFVARFYKVEDMCLRLSTRILDGRLGKLREGILTFEIHLIKSDEKMIVVSFDLLNETRSPFCDISQIDQALLI